jgi:hypothetical protein
MLRIPNCFLWTGESLGLKLDTCISMSINVFLYILQTRTNEIKTSQLRAGLSEETSQSEPKDYRYDYSPKVCLYHVL